MEVSDTYAASSSPRPAYTPAPTRANTQTKPSKKTGVYLPRPTGSAQVFSPEMPSHLAGSAETVSEGLTRPVASGLHAISINSQQRPTFAHSDITHPGADTILIENNYPRPSTESYTQTTNKGTYAKPQFRPKPTNNKFATDKYVLVQTISNENGAAGGGTGGYGGGKPQGSISDNDIESIESIILMLNDTKTGPQYNTNGRPQTAYGSYDYSTTQSGTTKYPTTTYVFASSTKRPPIFSNSYESATSSYGTTAGGYGTTAAAGGNYGGNSVVPAPYGTSTIGTASGTLVVKGPTLSFNPPSSARPPSTSYVFSTTTPKRPPPQGTSGTYNKISSQATSGTYNKISSTTSTTNKKPTKAKRPANHKTTSKPLSTSYVTGSTTARPPSSPSKRPPSISSYSPQPLSQTGHPSTYAPLLNAISSSTPAPTVIVLGPYGLLATDAPSPTVHITPKPQVNLVTSSSTWANRPTINNKYTPIKMPSPSYVPITNQPSYTDQPQVYTSLTASSTPGYGNISPQYGGNSPQYGNAPQYGGNTPGYGGNTQVISNDFDDPGYYGISATSTLRPVAPPIIQQTITSSSIYTVVDDTSSPSPYPNYGAYGNVEEGIEQSTLNSEYYTSPNDVNNFPPVRNPNLNMSGTFNGPEDYDISTPEFVEDELLNDKMGLLVSKIVESLQDSFDNLADVVYENKTKWTTAGSSSTGGSSTRPTIIKRPGSTTTGTKKPPQRQPSKKPASSSSSTRPGTTSVKPTKPNRRTTKRPGTTVFVNTTKKPANKVRSTFAHSLNIV